MMMDFLAKYTKANFSRRQVFFWALRLHFLFVILLFAILFSTSARAQENLLQIKPARCIALHQGQVCYQTLRVQWQLNTADHYCLYQEDNPSNALCWDKAKNGAGVYEFASNTSAQLILVRKRDMQIMASFLIDVAWVYDAKSHRENHWRIF